MGVIQDNGDLPDLDIATEADPTGARQQVSLSPATLTALENITATLDAASLAALETTSVANLLNPHPVSGTVNVANFPTGQTVDVTDRAARENGRIRVWNGTDEASILGRASIPSATDYGMAVVPLNIPRPSYQAVTGEITSGVAVATAQSLTLWHSATFVKDVFIIEIGANVGVQHTAGRFAFELQYIVAEAATPGGTQLSPQALDRGLAASGLTVRQLPAQPSNTGAVFQRAVQAPAAAATPQGTNYDGVVIYRAKDLDDYSDAIKLRNGVAEGLTVRQNIITALTTAPVFSVYARWVERA